MFLYIKNKLLLTDRKKDFINDTEREEEQATRLNVTLKRWKSFSFDFFLQNLEQCWRMNLTDSGPDKDIRRAPCSCTAAFVLFSVKKRGIEMR